MKRTAIATVLLLGLFAGVCFAATYYAYGTQVQGQWTRGQSDFELRTNASDTTFTYMRANTMTEVAWDQRAWGVHTACYTAANQYITGLNEQLQSVVEGIQFYPRPVTNSNVNIPKAGVGSVMMETFHRSAESIHSPLFRAEVIMSTASRSFGSRSQGELHAYVDGALLVVPEYDMTLLQEKVAQTDAAEVGVAIPSNQIGDVLNGRMIIPGWSVERVSAVLYDIHAYEAANMEFGDSRPVYVFDGDGNNVTVGFMRPNGDLKIACFSI